MATQRFLSLAVLVVIGFLGVATAGEDARPNVVLIVCDDLNDWIEPLGGHPQARTPAMAAFAATGVTFTNAHSNNPVCAPSRASMLTGLYPHTSGNLFWDKWHENPILSNSKTIMAHFRENGYRVVGSGKMMHHAVKSEWDEYPMAADYGPVAWDGEKRVGHPSVAEPFRSIGAIDGSFGSLDDVPFRGDPSARDGAGWIYGRWGTTKPFRYESADDRDLTPDELVARWAERRLARFAEEDGGPFFLAAGFIRPHTPMHAPKAFYDLFPLEDVLLPPILLGDADDTVYGEHLTSDQKGLRYYRTIAEAYGSEAEGVRRFTQAYLACTAFVDAQVGRVLRAIEDSGLAENTVVVITSDHGFNVGEKSYLFKNSPWEESTRIPLMIRAPGVGRADTRVAKPVSLIDLYPTLVDICGLPNDTMKNANGRPLDGHSLRALMTDPSGACWAGPTSALTMVHAAEAASKALTAEEQLDPARQHWSLRTARYRYVRYNSGAIELYDHANDPDEWWNLAHDARHAETIARLDRELRERILPIRLGPPRWGGGSDDHTPSEPATLLP